MTRATGRLIATTFVAGATVACAARDVPPQPAGPSVQHAFGGVVLILRTQSDGNVGYGAGVLRPGGRVLTNLHVVTGADELWVMLYEPGARPTHPSTGGC
jgi:S1-C subfamily serine protease